MRCPPYPCDNDCRCPGAQKCCEMNNCGMICQDPVGTDTAGVQSPPPCLDRIFTPVKLGTCPRINGCSADTVCADQCNSDCQCYGEQICCAYKYCGNLCVDPVKSTDPVPITPTDDTH